MLKTHSGHIVISASDLTALSNCEWSLVRRIDQVVGHKVEVLKDEDEMLKRAGKLGFVHEKRQLAEFKVDFPGQVVEFNGIDESIKIGSVEWEKVIYDLSGQTRVALREKAPVVYQGIFFDGDFQGFSDFLVLNEEGEYEVYDTKLARKAKITALLQLAAYAEQLQLNGIPTSSTVRLVLGNEGESVHKLADIMPVFKKRRDALRALIVEREHNFGAGGLEIQWGDPDFSICGTCANCKKEIEAHNDLLLVAGLTKIQRKHLLAAGITTWRELAMTKLDSVPGIGTKTFLRLRRQADQQLVVEQHGAIDDESVLVFNKEALSALPPASQGDIFFDFEGDPLFQEGENWNLDYLFGWVDRANEFFPLWAHDIKEGEKKAFEDFIAEIQRRLENFPDMHVYHYASYEKTHLVDLARRHGIGEEFVNKLLRKKLLIDLYPIVRNTFVIGGPDYSLKTVEKIFRADKREGLAKAVDSVIEYAKYCELRDEGDVEGATLKLEEIARYNKDDCISTHLLDEWLRKKAKKEAVEYVPSRDPGDISNIHPDVYYRLKNALPKMSRSEFSPEDEVRALTAAATIFHVREDAVGGSEHYRRLNTPIEEWNSARHIFTIDTCELVSDWTPNKNSFHRTIKVTGTWAAGSDPVVTGDSVTFFYGLGQPVGSGIEVAAEGAFSSGTIVDIDGESITLTEGFPKAGSKASNSKVVGSQHEVMPQAIDSRDFISTDKIQAAIIEWAENNVDGKDLETVLDPALDVMLRRGLRLAKKPEVANHMFDKAIIEALQQIENSYLAVQGPPGAGKSHNGAAAIAYLVNERNWKIGVVAQSHPTVENLFRAVSKAGVDTSRLTKKPQKGSVAKENERTDLAWTPGSSFKKFIGADHGYVFGGTVWDFVNRDIIKREEFKLDLLVIDEAGQFSLANTIAASVAAKRLLLLGDPQQLPQVSQAAHEDPIDTSALGWLTEGHDVLPEEFGYFLDQSWRMHEALCDVVAELSYEGKLKSKGLDRRLEGQAPGFFPVPIHHTDNSTESTEEADAVVDKVRELVSLQWVEEGNTGMLGAVEKNIIIVAPYNAQVQLIEAKLKAAGFGEIPVGTVDKFQGKEAAIAIVSMTASSATDVPRGIEFLLMQNRINVAISRAKWAAFMFYSPELTEFLPTNVEQLKILSRFIGLVNPENREIKN